MTSVTLKDQNPSTDDSDFMNDTHVEYFKTKLSSWREQLLRDTDSTINDMKEAANDSDIIDIASNNVNQAIELRTRDRGRKLIKKIDQALKRIEDGSYGYCIETGEPIGFERLDARPIATLCLEAQERHERRERSFVK